jgi:hypothetical protein
LVDATLLLDEPTVMAKKRAEPEIPKTLFAIKGVESWYAWLKGFAEFRGIGVMGLIDEALRDHAKREGFPRPMPKRTK